MKVLIYTNFTQINMKASLNQISNFCHYLEIWKEFNHKEVGQLLYDYKPSVPEIKRLNALFLNNKKEDLRQMLNQIKLRFEFRSKNYDTRISTNY